MFEDFLNKYSKPDSRKWFDTKYDTRLQYGDPEALQTIALWNGGRTTKQPIPPDEEIYRIGSSGWNRKDNLAEFVLVDLDTDHGKQLPQEEVDALVEKLKGRMEIIRSTGGNGYHGRILIEPVPCHSESEYREIGRATRRKVSEEAGVQIPSDDCGMLWIASRTINERSFELVSNSSPTYRVEFKPGLPETRLKVEGTKDASIFEIVSLLSCIEPESYKSWLEVGQALHRLEGEANLPGFTVWEDWSRRSPKFQEGVCEVKWTTFGNPASQRLVGLTRLRELAGVKKDRYEFLTGNEFLERKFEHVELIQGFLVKDQYTLCAAAEKAGKTTVCLEAAVAMATGTPFLGKFETLKQRVVMMSRESGGGTLQETVKRQLRSRGLDKFPDDSFILSEDLPRFESDSDLATLERYLKDFGCEVFILDPVYLAMSASDQRTREKDGQQFDRIGQVCRSVGATPILIEHANKGSVDHKKPRPMKISDLPYGGGCAWARQFWLLSRTKEYVDGSGHHDLWFRVAGSSGLSALHRLAIDEGTDWHNRKWEVSIRPEGEVERETKVLVERCKQDALGDQVLKVLTKEPMLLSKIKEKVKCKRENLEAMIEQGLVEPCPMQVNGRPYTGYRRKT